MTQVNIPTWQSAIVKNWPNPERDAKLVQEYMQAEINDLRAALQAAPAQPVNQGLHDVPLPLLERLSKTLTNLGYATPEGGMEAFGARLEDQLYSLCRGVDGLLAKALAQAQAQTSSET